MISGLNNSPYAERCSLDSVTETLQGSFLEPTTRVLCLQCLKEVVSSRKVPFRFVDSIQGSLPGYSLDDRDPVPHRLTFEFG